MNGGAKRKRDRRIVVCVDQALSFCLKFKELINIQVTDEAEIDGRGETKRREGN